METLQINSEAKQLRIDLMGLKKDLKPLNRGYSYSHSFGIISVEAWGKPFLIVTEDTFFDGKHMGYNYYKLCVEFESDEEGFIMANKLDKKYNFPKMFNSKDSQEVLLKIQDEFVNAKIKVAA